MTIIPVPDFDPTQETYFTTYQCCPYKHNLEKGGVICTSQPTCETCGCKLVSCDKDGNIL